MALDGIFLSKLKNELKEVIVGLRVDKVNQPTKDEIVLSLRGKGCAYSLLCCVRADSPRVHLTAHKIGNPPTPPMFCMLLRKYIGKETIRCSNRIIVMRDGKKAGEFSGEGCTQADIMRVIAGEKVGETA